MWYQSKTVLLIVFAIGIAGVGGWIANIVKLVSGDFLPLTGMVVGRVIGVFMPPIGSVLGFL